MNISWKDSARSWHIKIKVGKITLVGRLIKQTSKDPFVIICDDINLNKKVLTEDYFIKNKITNPDEKIRLAKEKSIKLISKALKQRQPTYEFILNNNMEDVLTWKETKDYKTQEMVFSPFYFFDGKKKVSGEVAYLYGEKISRLNLSWMNKPSTKIESIDEKEYKKKVFEIMQTESYEKLEIIKCL